MKTSTMLAFGIRQPRQWLLFWLVLSLCRGVAQPAYQPGVSYFGRSNYVEYIAGDLPLVISAPHGGTLCPSEIPDRKEGEFTSDALTEELARAVREGFEDRLGHCPHIIICRLDRHKVDCNRPLEEGAGEDPAARQAWNDFQQFIETARNTVLAQTHAGLYIDLHGQSHAVKRIELGYCLTDTQLTNSDRAINDPAYAEASTIRALTRRANIHFSELLRGPNSLGGLLAAKGYPAVPSPAMPNPGPGNSYFDGGYNVRRHGSAQGGAIDGVQIEVNYSGIRETDLNRITFARALAEVCDAYFATNYGLDLRTSPTRSSRPPVRAQ